ncbi:MAG: BON domain-containing protein [Hydrogenophaga sp.]|nr:BON domain-containing protein [Hydrogenophaga sp.]
MKTDTQLKKDIEAELEWEPAVSAAHIGVLVDNGVVTLTGHLETFAEKHVAERVVRRVAGVRAIANEIDIKLAPGHVRSDADIAQAIESAFSWHTLIPGDRILVKVEQGWVTLSGAVNWDYQRRLAEQTVRPVMGVRGVTNRIQIEVTSTPTNIAERIEQALSRQAEREAKSIEIAVHGTTATLRGKVHSWAERAAAQGAAFSAPGITSVINELKVTG